LENHHESERLGSIAPDHMPQSSAGQHRELPKRSTKRTKILRDGIRASLWGPVFVNASVVA